MIKKEQFSLKGHNTFGIDAKSSVFVEYNTERELLEIVSLVKKQKLKPPYLHIGEGSNILFVNNFPGTILHSKIDSVTILSEDQDNILVKVGSGKNWDSFVALCVENRWYGAENLSLIPGETGAAAVQNIGAYGAEIKDIIFSVETLNILTGEKRIFTNRECCYSYRNSIFKLAENKRLIVTGVVFNLSKQERYNLTYDNLSKAISEFQSPSLEIIRNTVISIRDEKLPDPRVIGSAGSFFMNPIVSKEKLTELISIYPNIPHYPLIDNKEGEVKLAAGWLIEQCGWKGKSLGRAGVYEKQALVIINKGGAIGDEILALSNEIILSVKQKFGIDLHPEVQIVEG